MVVAVFWVRCISCKKEREGESGKNIDVGVENSGSFIYNNALAGVKDSDVDVDDGNIYGGSFCPSLKTTMLMLMMMMAVFVRVQRQQC